MEEKINQRVMLTKKLLKNSLTEILQTKSIYHVSIRELCERSGINRSTFYKYYGSQFDLLAEIEQDLLRDVELSLSKDDIQNPKVLSDLLSYIENNIDLVRLLFNSNVDPEFPGKLFSMPKIQIMVKELLLSDVPSEEFEYSFSFLVFGAYQVVRMWINKETRESADYLASLIMKQLKR